MPDNDIWFGAAVFAINSKTEGKCAHVYEGNKRAEHDQR